MWPGDGVTGLVDRDSGQQGSRRQGRKTAAVPRGQERGSWRQEWCSEGSRERGPRPRTPPAWRGPLPDLPPAAQLHHALPHLSSQLCNRTLGGPGGPCDAAGPRRGCTNQGTWREGTSRKGTRGALGDDPCFLQPQARGQGAHRAGRPHSSDAGEHHDRKGTAPTGWPTYT